MVDFIESFEIFVGKILGLLYLRRRVIPTSLVVCLLSLFWRLSHNSDPYALPKFSVPSHSLFVSFWSQVIPKPFVFQYPQATPTSHIYQPSSSLSIAPVYHTHIISFRSDPPHQQLPPHLPLRIIKLNLHTLRQTTNDPPNNTLKKPQRINHCRKTALRVLFLTLLAQMVHHMPNDH